MNKLSFEEALIRILKEDIRYSADAYIFMRNALDCAVGMLDKPRTGKDRHLTARELMDCTRDYAIEMFGPMALRVLNHWGIYSTKDFGKIVFNLIGQGVFGKTEEDKLDDFDNGYDFDTAFRDPFLPPSRRGVASSVKRKMKKQ
jgi:uncharacterized repeat protein (TIGR04138 family)